MKEMPSSPNPAEKAPGPPHALQAGPGVLPRPPLTERVLEVLHEGALLQAVLPLHVVGRHVARPVGRVPHPPPGPGVVQQPQALVLLDVQLLALLGCVVPLGYDDDLLCHLSWSPSASETFGEAH